MPTLTLDLLQQRLSSWRGCDLAKSANAVLGEGGPNAEIMFIGEAPGQREDELKRPFVGPAGDLLNELLSGIGIRREDVYISNVVKYRPPQNREPSDNEKRQCLPWLMLEIAIVRPKVIVPLGRHALAQFFPSLSIGKVHGIPRLLRVGESGTTVTVFPMYHPAAALHAGGLRAVLEEDFRRLGSF
jgi:DNA polymerase